MAFHVQLQIVKLLGRKLIKLLLQTSGIEQNPGPPRKLTCGNCRTVGKKQKKETTVLLHNLWLGTQSMFRDREG